MREWLPGMGVWLPGMPRQSPLLLPHSLFSTSFFDWWLVAPLKIKTRERVCQKHSYSLSHQRKESRANWRSAVVERPKKIRKKENVLNGECPWNREKKALAGPLCVCHMETVCRNSGRRASQSSRSRRPQGWGNETTQLVGALQSRH